MNNSSSKPTQHKLTFTGVIPHNGEHWYSCEKCGKSDWIASYGTEDQLDFYSKPCVAATPRAAKEPARLAT